MEESVNVLKFAEARASEISSMMEDINYKKNKTAFQRLPPHMRRRAASHNPKRVPRKLRDSFLVQNPHASSKPKKANKKQLKRQQRKKHQKQLTHFPQEFASRSRPDAMWLETHIWHAKRFKMENMYGYKLPIHSNDKKLGAVHKAVTESAMLVDLSYLCCIAFEGPEDQLCEHLSSLTDKMAVNHFGSEKYKDGRTEGHAFLYHPNSFPYEAIGPVTFMWQPTIFDDSVDSTNTKNIVRKLWIWCHPSFHDELVDVLINIFKLKEVSFSEDSNSFNVLTIDKSDIETSNCSDKDISESNQQPAFASKTNFEKVNLKFQRKKVYTADNIKMSLLKDKLIRFRIIGPSAYSNLCSVLELGNIDQVSSPDHKVMECDLNMQNGDLSESLSSTILVNGNVTDIKDHKEDLDFVGNNESFFSTSKKRKMSLECETIQKHCKLDNVIETECKEKNDNITKSVINRTHGKQNEPNLVSINIEEINKTDVSSLCSNSKLWWQSYYKNNSAKSSHAQRQILINCLQSRHLNYYIPPGSIFGLTVRDPRVVTRGQQKKFSPAIDSFDGKEIFDKICTCEMANSPLWEENIRCEVTATQIPESEINKERSKYAISRECLNFGDRESRVPILLIHQKGTDGFASGFDLVAPLGWGMAFWIPLIFNGGRAVGLRDLNFVNLETGQPSFPLSYPDTKAGNTNEEKIRIQELTVYFKRPKAKRPNYFTFGVPNPFFMPWEVLINEWKKEIEDVGSNIFFPNVISKKNMSYENISFDNDCKKDFFVWRQKEIQDLCQLFDQLNKVPKRNVADKKYGSIKQNYNDFLASSIKYFRKIVNSYILIKVKCKGRGCPTKHSGIFMPNECDIKEMKSSCNYLGPVEFNHTSKSKKLSNEFSSTVGTENFCDKNAKHLNELDKEGLSKDVCNGHINVKDLERPKVQKIKSCCSRQMIGYLSEGGFSSILGKGCGIGHCSFLGLLIMLKNCINYQIAPLVLIREQHSFQYRLCSIEVIKNYL